jgi:DNA-binding winged helix-turn-helix (wHTH) protein
MRSDVLIFSPFRLDSVNQELWRNAERIGLRPKAFAFLSYLARHPQRLVTKQELLRNLWPSASVSEELLRGYVRELRAVLGDDAKAPRYVMTVATRGYKFLPRVSAASLWPSTAPLADERDGASFTPDDIARYLESIFPEKVIPSRIARQLCEIAGSSAIQSAGLTREISVLRPSPPGARSARWNATHACAEFVPRPQRGPGQRW